MVNLHTVSFGAVVSAGLASAFPLAPSSSAPRWNHLVPTFPIPDVNSTPSKTYPTNYFTQPIDHFPSDKKYAPNVNGTYRQRFWFDASAYKPGGPVIMIDSGEINGEDRLAYIDVGIAKILANATGGIACILEMRYYGNSTVTPTLTTDDLRFLDTKQGLADSANFAKNVKFPGLEQYNLNSPHTPWIIYGGSYAGQKSAYQRVAYPDVFWGAISSSGVVAPRVNFWQYYDPIIQHANQTCIQTIEKAVTKFDSVMFGRDRKANATMKQAFGFADLVHADDMGSVLTWPLGLWQGKNWDTTATSDPGVELNAWDHFCTNLTTSTAAPLLGSPELGKYAAQISRHIDSTCGNYSREACLGTHDPRALSATDLSQTWRLWTWQVCREEGFYQTAPPKGHSPSVVSQTYQTQAMQRYCDYAFPPGQYTRIPKTPDVSIPLGYGGFNIAHDRLAFINGEADPWKGVCTASPDAPKRQNTIQRPFYTIPGAVHRWDENGLPGGVNNPNLPPEIRKVQTYEIQFVTAWLKDFKKTDKTPR